MESCPDCTEAKQLYKNNPDYEIIDIGQQARNLKEFLALRDHHPAFAKVRERGTIGIPCFVKDDGSVVISLKRYLASLSESPAASEEKPAAAFAVANESEPSYQEGAACSLDGTGC